MQDGDPLKLKSLKYRNTRLVGTTNHLRLFMTQLGFRWTIILILDPVNNEALETLR